MKIIEEEWMIGSKKTIEKVRKILNEKVKYNGECF